MKKILILLTADRFSSPARLAVQVIEHRSRDRFTMMIGCTWQGGSEPSEFFQELRKRGIPLAILPQRHSLDPSPIWAAVRMVRQEQIDLVESHGFKACFLGFFLKLLTGKPWITVMHGHTAENFRVKFYAWLELRLARFCDRIVTVSDEMRNRLVARGLTAKKTVTIHNAIDPAQFTSGETQVNRAMYGIADEDDLIGVIGRFSPEKGQDLFVRAFSQFAAEKSTVKTIFLGEGPTEPEIRDQVRAKGLLQRVVFAGYQPRIADFYPLLDLVVIPSRSEGLPSVALEALYHRVPVVATAVGGTGEVIYHEKTGLLIPPNDADKLAEAIMRLLDNRPLSAELAATGHDLICEKFLPETRAQAFMSLYESLGDKG